MALVSVAAPSVARADASPLGGCGCGSDDTSSYDGAGGSAPRCSIDGCEGAGTACRLERMDNGNIATGAWRAMRACTAEQRDRGWERLCGEEDLDDVVVYCDPAGAPDPAATGAGGGGGDPGGGGDAADSGGDDPGGGGDAGDGGGAARLTHDARPGATPRSGRRVTTACPQMPTWRDRSAVPAMLTFGAAASVVVLRSARRRAGSSRSSPR